LPGSDVLPEEQNIMNERRGTAAADAGLALRSRQIHFAWLFASLILYILVSPWFDAIGSLATVSLSLVLIAAAYSSLESGSIWSPLLLVTASLCMSWLDELFALPLLALVARVLYIGTFLFAVVRVFQYVVRSSTVTFNVLMAGVSVYLLIGLCWTLFYLGLWDLVPDAFSGRLTASSIAGARLREMLYYSYVSLTTVGYGDITAVSPLARALSILEVLSGVLYLGVLVARLVSMYKTGADTRGD
jgi:voltage-gated potassium channel